jgi:FkbM family methyltransferase
MVWDGHHLAETCYEVTGLPALSLKTVKNFSKQHFGRQRMAIAVSGSMPQNEILRRLNFLFGDWFEAEMELWRTYLKPGMTVIDIGANVGVYTFSAAQKVGLQGKVIAIEPFQDCITCLEETVRINQLPWVKIYAGAASNYDGSARLSLHSSSELNEVISDNLYEPSSNQTFPINCFTLDSLLEKENLTQVDWLKIDAEGHEMQVLLGAETLLTRFTPHILYENIAGIQSSNFAVSEYLCSIGYQLYYYRPYLQELVPVQKIEEIAGHLNLIAIYPKQKQD